MTLGYCLFDRISQSPMFYAKVATVATASLSWRIAIKGQPADCCFSSQFPSYPSFAPRFVASAIPRKESAKVRNRRWRRKFNGTPSRPRLSVFCSADQLYAMLVDDQNKNNIFYASTLQKHIRGNPPCTTIEAAKRVGVELIKTCIELDISEISSYDRNGFSRGERMQAFEIAISKHGFLTN